MLRLPLKPHLFNFLNQTSLTRRLRNIAPDSRQAGFTENFKVNKKNHAIGYIWREKIIFT